MKRLLVSFSALLMSSSAFAITPFSMPWVNAPVRNSTYVSADHPGAVFVMEFAANFCGACNENAPNVDAMASHYANEPRVQVLDTMIDSSDSEIARWIARHHPNHAVLKDVGRNVWNQLHEDYIPTMIVADCHGDVKFRNTGVWDDGVKAEIQNTIDELLAQPCN